MDRREQVASGREIIRDRASSKTLKQPPGVEACQPLINSKMATSTAEPLTVTREHYESPSFSDSSFLDCNVRHFGSVDF